MTRALQQIVQAVRLLEAVDGRPVKMSHIQRQLAGSRWGAWSHGADLWRVLEELREQGKVTRESSPKGAWGWRIRR